MASSKLQRIRKACRLKVNLEIVRLEARLRTRLASRIWDEIEAEWRAMDDFDAYLPEQRRDFLIKKANQHEIELVGVL